MGKTNYENTKEDELEQYIDEKSEEFFETDLTKLWLRDIAKYPLLSFDEEKKLGKSLKAKEGLEILDDKNQLDLETLFVSLIDNPSTKEILKLLEDLYCRLDEHSLDEYSEKIEKYKRLFEQMNRPLTEKELKDNFNCCRIDKKIDPKELLGQVKRFSEYLEAKYKMFHANLRLVVRPAKRYAYSANMEFIDLASEGSMGLMKAVDKYDADLGFKFSTYAIWWIRQSISRYVNENASSFKMRANEYKEIKDFRDAVERLEYETKSKYTAEDLSKIFDMPYQEVVGKLYYNNSFVSLNGNIGEDEDTTLEEIIPGQEVDFEENIFQEEMRSLLDGCFSFLKPQEELVMRLLTGLNEEHRAYNTYEIAKKMKKTRTAINAIQIRSMKKLRMIVQRNERAKQLVHYMK